MTDWVLESALRSLMMATAVWTGIKLLRVKSVVAQKTAWILVLLAAFAMPLLMRWQVLQPKTAVVVSVQKLKQMYTSADPVVTPDIAVFPTIASSTSPAKRWDLARWKDFVAPAYLLVMAVLLLRLIVGLVLAFRLWHRAEPASVLLDPRASVRISSRIETPVTIGSTILLPLSHADWDRDKLRVVLAHERSHIRQGDFYFQLLAGVYTALFWFSPLGWWLKKEISDLGEAISDGAALKESQSRATYAQVLVGFAAVRRRPLAGVAMARSSNIRRRIDRLLVEQNFLGAFTACRWHLAAAAVIVPLAVVSAVGLVRVQPAEAMKLPQLRGPVVAAVPVSASIPVRALTHFAHAVAAVQASAQTSAQTSSQGSSSVSFSDSKQNSYAVVSGDANNSSGAGDLGEAFNKVKSKMHGNYIWFERDGKSYVISDPALYNQAKDYLRPIEELGRRQGELGREQGRLGEEQGRLGELQASASEPAPDLSKEIANVQAALEKLQQTKRNAEIKQDELADMQSRLADLQGQLGDLQGKIGEKQAKFGDQQAKLGEQQAKLGEQQAELGRQQAQLSKEVTSKMEALIDSAMRSGKARPIE